MNYSKHPTIYLFEREDGSQVLVTIYQDGEVELAERPDNSDIWGPPITGRKA